MRLFALFTGAGLGSGLLVWAMGSGIFSPGLAAEGEKHPAGAMTVLLGKAADEIEILSLSEQDMAGDEQWEPDAVEGQAEQEGLEEDEEAGSGAFPPFTPFDFSYSTSLLEEMEALLQLPVDAAKGQGREVILLAQNGDAAAQYRVGLAMIVFRFHEKDKVMQVRESWLTQAAERGYLPAQKLLYYLYLNGFGSDSPDLGKAISYLRAAVEQGDAVAELEYDFLVSQDWIEDEEPQAGLERLHQRAAMEKGRALGELGAQELEAVYTARVALGLSYAIGLGELERDVPLSLRYFKAVREMREDDFIDVFLFSLESLVEADATGSSWLVQLRDLVLAPMPEGKEARALRLEAQYLYGFLLIEGALDLEGDTLEQGTEYLRAIAGQHAGASFALALELFDPWFRELEAGDEPRVREACALYAQAQRLGSGEAVSRLARCYELLGEPLRAMDLLQQSVDAGGLTRRSDLRQLAEVCLTHGLVPRALDYYATLAAQGDACALVKLAEMYQRGEVVSRDLGKARGYLDALERVDRWRAVHLRRAWAVGQ